MVANPTGYNNLNIDLVGFILNARKFNKLVKHSQDGFVIAPWIWACNILTINRSSAL